VPGVTDFNLPDLRGYFLRGASGPTTRDTGKDGRAASFAGGNPSNAVGSIQDDQTGAHTHGVNTGTANGSLTAQVFVNSSGNTGINGRNIPTWTADPPRTNADPLSTAATGGHRGAVVVGVTSSDNPNTTESRPINAYVNYIIKL
jgi:microcystin-dependent protein